MGARPVFDHATLTQRACVCTKRTRRPLNQQIRIERAWEQRKTNHFIFFFFFASNIQARGHSTLLTTMRTSSLTFVSGDGAHHLILLRQFAPNVLDSTEDNEHQGMRATNTVRCGQVLQYLHKTTIVFSNLYLLRRKFPHQYGVFITQQTCPDRKVQ